MKFEIRPDKTFGKSLDTILSVVSGVCYVHSKYKFLVNSKSDLDNILYNSVLDDLNTVLKCIILNKASIKYDISTDEDKKKEYVFTNIFDCDYDILYNEIIKAMKKNININFVSTNSNIKYSMELFIQNIALTIQAVQTMDVYKYYKDLNCNENEFIAMLPNSLKELAEIIIKCNKAYKSFDVYVEEVIDNMCNICPDTINLLRDSALRTLRMH